MAWSEVLLSGAEVRARLGGLDTDVDDVDLALGLDELNARGISVWWDEGNAAGWLARAVELVSAEGERAMDALPYPEQAARVVEVASALGHVYRALNLPPPADPEYRRVLERDHHGSNTLAHCEDRAWGAWGAAHGAYRGSADAYRDDGYTGSAPVVGCITVHHRIVWRADGTVATDTLGEPGTEFWDRHYDTRPGTGGRWSWRSYAWHSTCESRGGVLGSGGCERWQNTLLPPLYLVYLQVREIVSAIARRGLLRTVIEGQRNALVANLDTAVALRLYNPSDGDVDGTLALLGRAEYGREQSMRTAPDAPKDLLEGMATASAAIAVIPGLQIAGAAGAAFAAGARAIVAALEEAALIAAQRLTDQYGRMALVVVRTRGGVERPELVAYERWTLAPEGERPSYALATPPAAAPPVGGRFDGWGRTEDDGTHEAPVGATLLVLGPELFAGARANFRALKVARAGAPVVPPVVLPPPSTGGWVVGLAGVGALGALAWAATRKA